MKWSTANYLRAPRPPMATCWSPIRLSETAPRPVSPTSFCPSHRSDRAAFRITSEETKHITATREEELAAGYSDAERETRLEGIPQLGSGPIFPVELLPALIKSFDPNELPSWARWCVGVDFGFAGGFAAVMIAWAHDTGELWVIDSFHDEAVVRALSRAAHSQR